MNGAKRITCASVNAGLKKAGIDVKMYRGDGYYYFIEQESISLFRAIDSLYQYTLDGQTVEGLVEYVKRQVEDCTW
jgi:hypothetical protein